MAAQRLKNWENKRKTHEAEQAVKKSTKKIKNMKTHMENMKNILAQQKGFASVHQDLATRLPKAEQQRDKAMRDVTNLQKLLEKNKRKTLEAEQAAKKSTKRIEHVETQLENVENILAQQKGFARVHHDLATRLPQVERERDEALREVNGLQQQLKKVNKQAKKSRHELTKSKNMCSNLRTQYDTVSSQLRELERDHNEAMRDVTNLQKSLEKSKLETQEAEQAVKKSTKKIKNMKTQMENMKNILAQQKGFARVHQDLATRLPKAEQQRDKAMRDVTNLQKLMEKNKRKTLEADQAAKKSTKTN